MVKGRVCFYGFLKIPVTFLYPIIVKGLVKLTWSYHTQFPERVEKKKMFLNHESLLRGLGSLAFALLYNAYRELPCLWEGSAPASRSHASP